LVGITTGIAERLLVWIGLAMSFTIRAGRSRHHRQSLRAAAHGPRRHAVHRGRLGAQHERRAGGIANDNNTVRVVTKRKTRGAAEATRWPRRRQGAHQPGGGRAPRGGLRAQRHSGRRHRATARPDRRPRRPPRALGAEADTHYLIAYSNRHPALSKTRSTGWVRLVHFTTDPEDLISDFTLTLAPYIEPLHRA
jgi:hypothetical protein